MKLSVVINTRNEEKTIRTCLESVKWADEIVVVDNASQDKTQAIAKEFTDMVFTYEDQPGYVEPIRNFAIEKATGDLLFILDADEVVPETLAQKLKEIANSDTDTAYWEIPRKNIIFNKWIEHTGWWPDYNTRLFKKGKVTFSDKIHVPPTPHGTGEKLEPKEGYAIVHYNYTNLSDYLIRSNRYSSIQAQTVVDGGYQFAWNDLIRKPLSEFLTRYFVWEGYKDGVYGLVLSLLQSVDIFITYVKAWELLKYPESKEEITLQAMAKEAQHAKKELTHWYFAKSAKSPLKKLFNKLS